MLCPMILVLEVARATGRHRFYRLDLAIFASHLYNEQQIFALSRKSPLNQIVG